VSVEFMRRVRKLGRYREAVDTVDRAEVRQLGTVTRRKLRMLDDAEKLEDMAAVPEIGLRLWAATGKVNRVWLLWNDAPAGGIKTSLILFDMELPIAVKVS